jgi:hypothetical protein
MSSHPFIFGARGGVTPDPVAIRHAYNGAIFTFWVGYGKDTDTDQDDIEIKRGVTDPVTGLVTETTATGPWDDYLTLIYS